MAQRDLPLDDEEPVGVVVVDVELGSSLARVVGELRQRELLGVHAMAGQSDVDLSRGQSLETTLAQVASAMGIAVFPVGRTNILRTGFAVNTDAITQVPAAGFQRIATDKYFAAYLRCPPGRA